MVFLVPSIPNHDPEHIHALQSHGAVSDHPDRLKTHQVCLHLIRWTVRWCMQQCEHAKLWGIVLIDCSEGVFTAESAPWRGRDTSYGRPLLHVFHPLFSLPISCLTVNKGQLSQKTDWFHFIFISSFQL